MIIRIGRVLKVLRTSGMINCTPQEIVSGTITETDTAQAYAMGEYIDATHQRNVNCIYALGPFS